MLIHDGIFSWKGFGGLFNLASGSCRLRIFDLAGGRGRKVAFLKPMVVVVSELADNGSRMNKVSVRGCAGHIATCVAEQFNIDPQRMLFVAYAVASTYGEHNQYVIDAEYDVAEFVWRGDKALHPKWKTLQAPLLEIVRGFVEPTD